MQEELFGSECPIEGIIERKLEEARRLTREHKKYYLLRYHHGNLQRSINKGVCIDTPEKPSWWYLGYMHKQKFSLWFRIKCFFGIKPKVKGSILDGSFMNVPFDKVVYPRWENPTSKVLFTYEPGETK